MPHKETIRGTRRVRWLGQIKLQGTRKRRVFATKQEAIAWEVEARRQVRNPALPRSVAMVSVIDWSDAYLEYALQYNVGKVYSEKKRVMQRLIEAIGGETAVSAITSGMALTHLQSYYQTHSGHDANKERKNLMAAWQFGCRFLEGFPTSNPFGMVPKFPEVTHPRYMPSQQDFWKVVAVAEGQDKVLLMMFLHTAGRRGELYRLRWTDVDFDGHRIRLTTRKRQHGSEDTAWIPMTGGLTEALMSHRQSAINEWVFTQTEGRHTGKPYAENRGFPQELCRTAGVKPFGCHAIRHLTASILAQHNTPMVQIQVILRHQNLATTERYVRGLESARRYLKVLEGGKLEQRSTSGSTGKETGLRAITP